MKKIQKSFKIQGRTISYEIIKLDKDNYLIPNNNPSLHSTKSELTEPKMGVVKKNFDEDLKFLVPKSWEGDFLSNISNNLISVVKKHKINYGRILISDIHIYVAECVFISSCIMKDWKNEVLDITMKQKIFVFFMENVIKELNLR
jgi:hypothetical protein